MMGESFHPSLPQKLLEFMIEKILRLQTNLGSAILGYDLIHIYLNILNVRINLEGLELSLGHQHIDKISIRYKSNLEKVIRM